MSSLSSSTDVHQVYVAREDAFRFECILNKHRVKFHSYDSALQHAAQVFVFENNDSDRVKSLIHDNEIFTSEINEFIVSRNEVKGMKLYLVVAVIVAFITLILFLFTS